MDDDLTLRDAADENVYRLLTAQPFRFLRILCRVFEQRGVGVGRAVFISRTVPPISSLTGTARTIWISVSSFTRSVDIRYSS